MKSKRTTGGMLAYAWRNGQDHLAVIDWPENYICIDGKTLYTGIGSFHGDHPRNVIHLPNGQMIRIVEWLQLPMCKRYAQSIR